MRIALIALLSVAIAAASLAAEVPRPAPDFSILLPGGKALPLKALHGKVVLLAFIFTTCSHCQQLVQTLAPIQREYEAKGVQFLASAFNEGVNDAAVTNFMDVFHPGFPVGMDDRAS